MYMAIGKQLHHSVLYRVHVQIHTMDGLCVLSFVNRMKSMSCQGMCGDESNEQVEHVQSICHKSTWRFCQFDIVFWETLLSQWRGDRAKASKSERQRMENKWGKLWYLYSMYTLSKRKNFRSNKQFEWFSSFTERVRVCVCVCTSECASEWTHYTRTEYDLTFCAIPFSC